jgi:hypothetical protein
MSSVKSALTFPEPRRVTISRSGGRLSVEPPAIEIETPKGEHIEWVADGDFDFFVCFERDTPFLSHHFSRHNPASGRPRPTATGRYKYCVEVEGQLLDPDVIVKP